MLRTRLVAVISLLFISLIFMVNGFAQTYPDRPIRIVVPYPPGGGTDALVRIIAQAASVGLGQSVVVENKAGASTIIGNNAVAKSAPDGYTFGFPTQAFAVSSPTMPRRIWSRLCC